jgi:hypothetical protein
MSKGVHRITTITADTEITGNVTEISNEMTEIFVCKSVNHMPHFIQIGVHLKNLWQ